MRLRPETGAGIEKSGRGSRSQNQIQKFIFPPELFPNNWLPVQHFIYLDEPSKAVEVEVALRAGVGVEDADALAAQGKTHGEVRADAGLAHAALATGDGNDMGTAGRRLRTRAIAENRGYGGLHRGVPGGSGLGQVYGNTGAGRTRSLPQCDLRAAQQRLCTAKNRGVAQACQPAAAEVMKHA